MRTLSHETKQSQINKEGTCLDCVLANYQDFANQGVDDKVEKDQSHMAQFLALCLTSEAGEVAGAVTKHHIYAEYRANLDKIKEELGDVLWPVACLCSVYGWSIAEVMQDNMQKLRERYPDRYNQLDSALTDTKIERHDQLNRLLSLRACAAVTDLERDDIDQRIASLRQNGALLYVQQ
jgi:NTP pyrophosphatase (non-canonical NTP hydrolase)